MKLTVIGGGGVRSIFLAKSLAQRAKEIGIDHLAFMDNNEEKLAVFGELSKEVAKRIDSSLKFETTTDAKAAISGADFIITTIRAGGDDMRIVDEKIALSHNVLGQETTGAGGFSMALRSVGALAEYCELVKKYAKPGAPVFNFTNPAGLVSQTLRDMGYDFTYGICDAPSGLLHTIAAMLQCSYSDLSTECYGLNHLSFFKSIRLNGEEILQKLIDSDELYQKTDMRYFEKELAQHMGLLLNEYLYYFFYREQSVENISNSAKTRGENILEINKKMFDELRCLDPHRDFETCIEVFEHWYGVREDSYMAQETSCGNGREKFKFDIFSPDFGGYAGVALAFINAVQTGAQSEMIMCLPNNGSIPGLADDDVVEVTCFIGKDGAIPKKIEAPSDTSMEIIRRVKAYERRAARAIICKDKAMAIEALMLHPLVNSYPTAKSLVQEYLNANDRFCGKWS